MSQLKFFIEDINRALGKNKFRILFIWMTRSFVGVLLYRVERSLFLLFGKLYAIIRFLFLPLILLLQAYSNIDIHYKANIKGGILILHPSVGCVISGRATIGCNITLTGGNVIGYRGGKKGREFIIGDNCNLGANATIIGPILLGNTVQVGASACVVKSFENGNCVLIGVPAYEA